MKEKITVLIVNYNTSDFIEFTLHALEKLTKHPFKTIILDNGSKQKDYNNLQKIAKNYSNCKVERKEWNLTGSIAHGTGLNYLIKKVDTPYFCILDADAMWLIKNWDDILIQKMGNEIKAIGTQAPPPKPQDFPLMFAILFETDTFNQLNVDMRPKNIDKLQDTGWEIRDKYLKANLKGINAIQKNTREFKDGPFSNITCSEYYLEGYDHIFASHFGRGSSTSSGKYKKSSMLSKIPILKKYITLQSWKKEKKIWIKTAYEIVEKQL